MIHSQLQVPGTMTTLDKDKVATWQTFEGSSTGLAVRDNIDIQIVGEHADEIFPLLFQLF